MSIRSPYVPSAPSYGAALNMGGLYKLALHNVLVSLNFVAERFSSLSTARLKTRQLLQNCLGALDVTYIKVRVPAIDKPIYQTRKGEVATNVLVVCSRDLQFIFVLPGWEGSASDSRVFHDAVTRPNGLRVPTGYYYLVDGGYTNGEGFFAPYRGTRREMYVDPMENVVFPLETQNVDDIDVVGTVDSSDQWTAWRNDLALQMFNEWRGRRVAEVVEITTRARRAARAATVRNVRSAWE
ncbi:hypothetical protein ACLB2K_040365 [Fragaria x ananassa]